MTHPPTAHDAVGSRPTAAVCEFIAGLNFAQIPPRVIHVAKRLMIDWIGCTLAGKDARPTLIIENFA